MQVKSGSKTRGSKTLTVGLALLLAAGALGACGGDDGGGLTLRALAEPKLEIAAGIKYGITLELSGVPGTDVFVDIDNPYKEFFEFPSDSVRFQPKDDPPKKTVELTALKESAGHLSVVFTLRDTASTRTLQVAIVKP